MKTADFPSVDLNQVLNVGQLPAMPQSALSLLNLSRDPNSGPAEYAAAIEVDPGLTVQVLRFVNSSYFGFRHEISNVKQAITLVGVRTIKNFALYSAVFSMVPQPEVRPVRSTQALARFVASRVVRAFDGQGAGDGRSGGAVRGRVVAGHGGPAAGQGGSRRVRHAVRSSKQRGQQDSALATRRARLRLEPRRGPPASWRDNGISRKPSPC